MEAVQGARDDSTLAQGSLGVFEGWGWRQGGRSWARGGRICGRRREGIAAAAAVVIAAKFRNGCEKLQRREAGLMSY